MKITFAEEILFENTRNNKKKIAVIVVYSFGCVRLFIESGRVQFKNNESSTFTSMFDNLLNNEEIMMLASGIEELAKDVMKKYIERYDKLRQRFTI